ncbi:MAG: pantetheine-phosphate adenylyltransferase [Bacteroidales bacterium]|nr:pantetheine-phosphate adenylyltransferase [Bacteroidales bacterium]
MKALFAGSFNPFTIGHESIVKRTLCFADEVVIAIGINNAKENPETETEERIQTIRSYFTDEPRVTVLAYEGLTVDFARQVQADVMVRGVRSVKDFEYEREMADVNRKISGMETILLFSEPELSAVSSSIVRELKAHGKDISKFLPQK